MNTMDSAPLDGTTIVGIYEDGECLIFYSDNPVCILGSRNGSFPAGWATAPEADVDTNLPMDEPDGWEEY